MALVTRNPGDVIRSLDVDQYNYLLTGTMADQAVTIPGTTVFGTFGVKPVAGPTITSAPLTGGGGATQWWFAIVPVTSGVDGAPGPVFQATVLGPNPLTGSNYFTVNFANSPGATAYKLIGGTGTTQPALSTFAQIGTALTATNGQATYSMLANASTSAYTVTNVPVGGGMTNPWKASGHQTVNHADTNGSTIALPINVTDYTDGNLNTSTYLYTVVQPGIYMVSGGCSSAHFTAGDRWVGLYQNLGLFRYLDGTNASTNSGNSRLAGTSTVACHVGDTLSIGVNTPGTTANGITAGWADFIYLSPL